MPEKILTSVPDGTPTKMVVVRLSDLEQLKTSLGAIWGFIEILNSNCNYQTDFKDVLKALFEPVIPLVFETRAPLCATNLEKASNGND